jgi:hypothetical protein
MDSATWTNSAVSRKYVLAGSTLPASRHPDVRSMLTRFASPAAASNPSAVK